MNPNEYLSGFFAELESLVDGKGTRHAISTDDGGKVVIHLGAGDWYREAAIELDPDPEKAALAAAQAETTWPSRI